MGNNKKHQAEIAIDIADINIFESMNKLLNDELNIILDNMIHTRIAAEIDKELQFELNEIITIFEYHGEKFRMAAI